MRDLWATPQRHDAQTPKTLEQITAMRESQPCGVANLNEQILYGFHLPAFSRPDQTKSKHGKKYLPLTEGSLRLNPAFVSWLMGWPILLPKDSGSWEMEYTRWLRQMRFALSFVLCLQVRVESEGG